MSNSLVEVRSALINKVFEGRADMIALCEEAFKKKFRTIARGLRMSFSTPAHDMLSNLRRKCAESNATEIPRPEETFKHLRS